MRIIDLHLFVSAIASITTCTDPSIQLDGVVATANRLCSPYRSHHTVSFQPASDSSDCPAPFVRAWNTKYEVAFSLTPIDYTPSPRPVTVCQHIAVSYVGEWVELRVPSSLLEPLFRLVERLFGRFPYHSIEPIVQAWLLRPRLAGFHYDRPVFWRADDDNHPLDLTALVDVESSAVISCGDLVLYPLGDAPVPAWWYPGERFFDCTLGEEERTQDRFPVALPVALYRRNQPVAAAALYGPATIQTNSGAIDVPEGYWLAVHPLFD